VSTFNLDNGDDSKTAWLTLGVCFLAAVLVEHGSGVEECNLGPQDQRQVSKDLPAIKRFVFAYSDHAPPGGFAVAKMTE